MAGTGTFAEYLTVPAGGRRQDRRRHPVRDRLAHRLRRLHRRRAPPSTPPRSQPGSKVVVFGCGGVGIAAIQGAHVAGASIIVAVDLNDDKLELAKTFGATHGCKPDDLAALQAELTGDGFDYAFEAIGLPVTMRAALRRRPPRRHRLRDRRRRHGQGGLVQRLRDLLLREELHGQLLRLGRRPLRLPPAPQPLEVAASSTSTA